MKMPDDYEQRFINWTNEFNDLIQRNIYGKSKETFVTALLEAFNQIGFNRCRAPNNLVVNVEVTIGAEIAQTVLNKYRLQSHTQAANKLLVGIVYSMIELEFKLFHPQTTYELDSESTKAIELIKQYDLLGFADEIDVG
jgi:hypothetical protein